MFDWNGFQVKADGVPIVAHFKPLLGSGSVVLFGPGNKSLQGGVKAFARHFEQIQIWSSCWRLQKLTGVAPELQNFEIFVDQHTGRSITRKQQPVGLALRVHGAGCGRGSDGRTSVSEQSRSNV